MLGSASRSPTRRWPPRSAELQAWRPAGAQRVETATGSQGLPARRRDPHLRRLVAAAGPRRSSRPGLGDGPLPVAGQRAADQRVALRAPARRRVQPARLGERGAGAQGLVVPVRLVGLRRQGPARGARRPGRAAGSAARYCGGGNLAGCRQCCWTRCARRPPSRPPPSTRATRTARAGDQWCADAIVQSPLGGITHAADRLAEPARPTSRSSRSRPGAATTMTNLAAGRPVTASSTQLLLPGRARPSTATSAPAGPAAGRTTSGCTSTSARPSRSAGWCCTGRPRTARSYRIEVSGDGDLAHGLVHHRRRRRHRHAAFPRSTARYVRMHGVTRATSYGFSLWEFEVYAR